MTYKIGVGVSVATMSVCAGMRTDAERMYAASGIVRVS